MRVDQPNPEGPGAHPTQRAPMVDDRPIVFVHGSLADRRFWQGYLPLFPGRIMADIDLIGYGATPPWPVDRQLRMRDDSARLCDLIADLGRPAHIVAHSYGAAVSLRLAMERPDTVASLTLVEPVCFQILQDLGPRRALARAEIAAVVRTITLAISESAPEAGAARFVDYWNGAGTWLSLPEWRRQRMVDRIGQVARNFEAIAAEPLRLAHYRRCQSPTLLVSGERSPSAVRVVTSALAQVLPRGSLRIVEGAGTHAATHACARFIGDPKRATERHMLRTAD